MKHSLEKDRKYLKWHNQRGIAYVIFRNYSWFKEKYLSAIHRLEEADYKKDHPLLSDCYYMIGDVHDFNECPKAAIKAYNKSFELDSDHSEALREMGNMYERIGQYKKAVSVLKKSLRINPDDECAISDYECALDSGGAPLYSKDNIYWQAREYLAQDKPNFVLRVLAKKRSILARQTIARTHGVLDDTDAFLEQWYRIAHAKDKELIEVEYADWFYMTDSVWNSSTFWGILATCARENRFKYGVWPGFNSLYDKVVPFPVHRKIFSKADIKRCNKCSFLLAQYHIARINRDFKLAQELSSRYPQWPEIKKLCKKLSR